MLIKRRKLSGSLAQLLGPAALLLLVNVWRIFVASSSGTVAPFPHPAQPLSPSLGDVFTASQFKGVVKDEAWSPGGPRLLYTPTNARTDAVMAHFRTVRPRLLCGSVRTRLRDVLVLHCIREAVG